MRDYTYFAGGVLALFIIYIVCFYAPSLYHAAYDGRIVDVIITATLTALPPVLVWFCRPGFQG